MLREFTKQDIILFTKWVNQPYVLKWFKSADAWLEEINKRDNEYSFIKHFIYEVDGKPIGFCQYYEYVKGKETWHNNTDISNTYSIDYLIGEKEYLHLGHGIKLINELEEKLKITVCKKIIVQPDKDNLISRKTLLKAKYSYDSINDIFFKTL